MKKLPSQADLMSVAETTRGLCFLWAMVRWSRYAKVTTDDGRLWVVRSHADWGQGNGKEFRGRVECAQPGRDGHPRGYAGGYV